MTLVFVLRQLIIVPVVKVHLHEDIAEGTVATLISSFLHSLPRLHLKNRRPVPKLKPKCFSGNSNSNSRNSFVLPCYHFFTARLRREFPHCLTSFSSFSHSNKWSSPAPVISPFFFLLSFSQSHFTFTCAHCKLSPSLLRLSLPFFLPFSLELLLFLWGTVDVLAR